MGVAKAPVCNRMLRELVAMVRQGSEQPLTPAMWYSSPHGVGLTALAGVWCSASRVYDAWPHKENLMGQLHMGTSLLPRRLPTSDTGLRSLVLTSMCLGLACGVMACAPKLVGPTSTAGYFFSL